jgi:hypothetical protein
VIIVPESLQSDDEENRALMAEYNQNPALKEIADSLHYHRMLGGPTCLDCIRRANRMLFEHSV